MEHADPSTEPRLALGPVHLVPTNDGGLTMRAPRRSAVLRGALVTEIFPQLLPLLDGTRTRREVVDELDLPHWGAKLDSALDRLVDVGVVELVAPERARWPEHLQSVDRFLAQYGGDAASTARVARSRLVLAGEGPLLPSIALDLAASGAAELLVAARRPVSAVDVRHSPVLRAADVGADVAEVVRRLLDGGDSGTKVEAAAGFPTTVLEWQELLTGQDVAVLSVDAPVVSVPWLDDVNRAALATGTPWTSATMLQRAHVHVGPSVIPGQTACWKCFEYRFRSNLDAVSRYDEFQAFVAQGQEQLDQGNLPGFTSFTAGLVAVEALRLVARDRLQVRTAGRLLNIELWDYTMQTHPVLKLPRCPHCSPVHQVPQERTWS